MVKPICVPCGLFYRPEKNGQPVEEGKPHRERDQPVRWRGTNPDGPRWSEYKEWTSYKLYIGDKWKCRGCGSEIIVGINGIMAEHFHKDYEEVRTHFGGDAIPFVHDC